MTQNVVTGQQIGLLGGPLYTTYKVLGAVYLARQVAGTAVYWLETNDADFNEINHIDYLDAEGQLRTLRWNIDTRGFSCGYVEVDEKLVSILETFFSSIRRTEFTPALRDTALGCYEKGVTLAEASRRLASELFGDLGIRIFTPFEREFRDFSKTMLLKEAERTPEGEQCNLFCMVGEQRKALFKGASGPGGKGEYRLREGTVVDLADYDLVSNVRTRSVLQDAYFRTHTYVAGPGEVKYLAEMGSQFESHGVKPAAVQPRMSLTLMEPRVKRLMKKRDIAMEEVLDTSKEDLLKRAMETVGGFDFKETQRTGFELTGEYLEKLAGLGFEAVELKGIRKFLLDEVKKGTGRLRAREKEKHDQLLKDITFLSDNLLPFGKKQERVFNLFYYMNLYGGKAFVQWLYENHDWDRNVLEIEP
jgi:uncharacterized protein YllA (UPF0747 family)